MREQLIKLAKHQHIFLYIVEVTDNFISFYGLTDKELKSFIEYAPCKFSMNNKESLIILTIRRNKCKQ